MRVSTDKALGLLEQAKFVVDLLTLHGLSVAEVAETLGRSKGWVSIRTQTVTFRSGRATGRWGHDVGVRGGRRAETVGKRVLAGPTSVPTGLRTHCARRP
jgi:transposase